MKTLELFHQFRKKSIQLWKDYLTVEGTYTSLLPDSIYLKKLYFQRTGKRLDLSNPRTFTEKLNWLKIYDRKPEYTIMVDKLLARNYVIKKLGKDMGGILLVPIVGVWDRIEDINFDELPNQFVLKCNHDNGVIICKDKSCFNVAAAKKLLAWHLQRDYYKKCREWPYKNVKRKIICEEFMFNVNGEELLDYKLFCFNGVPRFVMVNSGRFSNHRTDMYDLDWNHLQMQDGHYPMAGDRFICPNCLGTMIQAAKTLSSNCSFLRVDFNLWNEQLYMGELTFFHSAGMEAFQPESWDETLGNWLTLPH